MAALGVLGVGMYLSLRRPDLFAYSIGALLLGFTMTQIGMYFSNRFGRSPRPDEKLDLGLKGLSGDAAMYHYTTPVPHLLVGPMGIWVLLPYHQRGTVRYEKGRWRLRGGGFMQTYMSIFGQEGLGRPGSEAESQIRAVGKYLAERLDMTPEPPINAALVFTNERAEVEAEDAPLPAMPIKKLKDFMRQRAKTKPLQGSLMRKVQESLPSG
jgi:hypothetical protein